MKLNLSKLSSLLQTTSILVFLSAPINSYALFMIEGAASYDLLATTKIAGKSLSTTKYDFILRTGLDASGSMLGVEGYYNFQTLTDEVEGSEGFTGKGYGAFAGYSFWSNKMRVWLTYIWAPTLTSDVNNYVYHGYGYKLGYGYNYLGPAYLYSELSFFRYTSFSDSAGTEIELTGNNVLFYRSITFGLSILF